MLFNGVKNQKIKALALAFLLPINIFAEDFGIAVPDQLSEDEFTENYKDQSEESDEGSSYVMGETEPSLPNEDSSSKGAFVAGDGLDENVREPTKRDKLLSTGYKAPYSLENEENLVTFEGDQVYGNFYDNGESSFSFSYIQDAYTVSDSRGVFQKSYVDAEDARRGGYLHFNFDSYINRNFLSTFYGLGLGVGFSEGEGIFTESTTEKSNVTFQLFTIPLDMRLGMSIGRGKYFRLSLAGGPSVMGISQSRDDKERGDDAKHRRQYSFGYFGHAKAQISLASIFNNMAFQGFREYQMTNMYLNLEARHQSYQNFQDEFTITGTSFGVGFTFEYL